MSRLEVQEPSTGEWKDLTNQILSGSDSLTLPNAAQYTPGGSVSVRLRPSPQGSLDPTWMRLTVQGRKQ